MISGQDLRGLQLTVLFNVWVQGVHCYRANNVNNKDIISAHSGYVVGGTQAVVKTLKNVSLVQPNLGGPNELVDETCHSEASSASIGSRS